jgi:4-amino-4-deoxy-L-arabinose transferase-like glycosyltransferase
VNRILWKHLLGAALLFFVYFYGLSRTGLLGPDEPRYAAIGREMAASGDWVTPRLFGEPWFEKPALLYWLIGAGFVSGLNADLAPRIPIACVSVVFLCFFYARVKREFGARAAVFSASMLASSAGWVAYSHIAVTDIPLSACFAASMLLCLGWIRSGGRRGLMLAGALLGCAVLAKGLVPLVLALPLIWVGRREWRDLLLFGAACVAVAAPWYLLCYARNGWPFADELFLRHHLERFTSGEQLHKQPFWYYLPVFAGLFLPWSPMLGLLRRQWIARDRRLIFVFLWLAFGFLFFSVSAGKLPGYVLPLLPAAALLAGVRAAGLATGGWWMAACAAPVALFPAIAAVLPSAVVHGLSRADIPGLNPRP